CSTSRLNFKPVLRRNNMLAEVVEKLKKTELQAASPAHCYTGPGDVECDFCTGRKLKAIKSCLMCQASFCETHLKRHYEVPGLKKHKLVNAYSHLQEKICSQHDKAIEIYCHTDQSYICYMCKMHEHRGHDTVAAVAERSEKQVRKRNLLHSVHALSQASPPDSERIFNELNCSIEKKRCEVRDLIRDQEKAELSRAEGLLDQLKKEIADLKRRDTELEQLSHTEDHIQFLQVTNSVSATEEPTPPQVSIMTLHKKRLEEFWRVEFNKIPPQGKRSHPAVKHNDGNLYLLSDRVKKLTLDPNTAHHSLSLSEMNQLVTWSREVQPYSDHPERFDYWAQVLSKESVCGCCYWEVERISGEWVFISVSYKDISRKGQGNDCGFGFNSQSWSLVCSSTLSFCHNNFQIKIRDPPPTRIGVYVDHSAGILSFYRVSDTVTLLHTVHTTFTQPLYAGFWLASGSTVRLCDPK
uniref:B30.2/SPRY domain-containing protein n=1 Tax=Electrophorus electricus TaxID=8005 RepID=A0A4W4ETQ5_ELEEL